MNGRRRTVLGAAVVGVAAIALLIARADLGGREHIDDQSVVMLGDSITAEGSWSAIFPEVSVVNEGRSGFTTAQLIPIARDVAAHQPRLLLVLTGTNDIRDGHPPSWTVGHLRELLDAVASNSPETIVIVQTVLPRRDRVFEVLELNESISAVAAERGLELLDLHDDFDDGQGGLRLDETYDGIHLTTAGYARWTQLLRPFIDSVS